MRFPLVAFVVALGLCASATSADEKGFAIRMFRPASVGEKYNLRLSWSRTEENLTNPGGTRLETRVDNRISSVDLTGVVEVLGVSPAGTPTKIRVKVTNRAMIGLPDASGVSVPPGDTITLAWNGRSFDASADPTRLPRSAAALVAHALSPMRHEGAPWATHDDVYGTPAKQREGATWDVNKKIVASDLRLAGFAVDPGQLKGASKFVAFTKVKKDPYLKVETNLRAVRFDVLPTARGSLPPGLKMVDGSLSLTVAKLLPAIPFKKSARSAESLNASMTFQGTAGPRNEPVTIVRVVRVNRQEEVTEMAESVAETE